MKVVSILGSPRTDGNTASIARQFTNTAENEGAEIQEYVLNKMNYRGCQGCMECKTNLDKCVLNDDLTDVLEAVQGADVILMATPIYYGDVSSQLKGFIDRTYSFLAPDYLSSSNPCRLQPGKKLVFVISQGAPDENAFKDVYPRYKFFFEWYGLETYLIRACGLDNSKDNEKREQIMKEAEDTARKIL